MARSRKKSVIYALILTLLIAVIAMPASAGAPTTTVEIVSESHSDDCGSFEITHSIEGRVRIFEFTPTRFQAVYHFIETFTNPANGKSLWTPNVGPDKTTIMEDGSAVLAIVGLISRLVVPGEGVVMQDVGRVVLYFESPDDQEPDVVFEAGPHDGLFPAVCDYLAD